MMTQATSLPTICFNLFETQQQLGYAIRTKAPQAKIKEIMTKISKSYEEFDAFREQSRDKMGFLGLQRKTWNWMKFVGCGLGFINCLPPLAASISSSVEANNNANYTQSTAVFATTIFTASFGFVIGFALGAYEAVDALRTDYEETQDSKLDEVQSLSKIWNIYKDLEIHHMESTSIEMDSTEVNETFDKLKTLFDEIKVTSDPNVETDLETQQKLETEQTLDLKERLLSLLLQVFPQENQAKQAFNENKKIEHKVMQQDSPITTNEDSGSMSNRIGFLDVKSADKEPLNSPNNSNIVSSEDLREIYQNNLKLLSNEFGFNVSKLYFENAEKPVKNNVQEEI